MFGIHWDWISEQIIYHTKASYPIERKINESHLRGGIVLSYPDRIK